MNIDIEKIDENQENFEKKKKIVIICLSAVLVFTTLIAGLFLAKKNKESSFEDNSIGEVVNENNKNDNEKGNDNDNENDSLIINESDYFFNKASGQITINILLSLVTGILFFFWENDKLPLMTSALVSSPGVGCLCLQISLCGFSPTDKIGAGFFEGVNWFGFGTFVPLIVITLLVEFILHFLIGSISKKE